MKHFMRSLRAALRQRGSILILTAFALPVILAGIGFAVDAGNIYMHKARLQNAADAAALGGAKIGMKDAGFDITKFDVDAANGKANGLVADDVGNGDALVAAASQTSDSRWTFSQEGQPGIVASSELSYRKSRNHPDTVRYYTVALSQDVPLVFMSYLLPRDSVTVNATSYVCVGQVTEEVEGGAPFTDLFIYEKHLDIVNSIENPDNYGSNKQIRTTFDGRVHYTSADAETIYSEQTKDNNEYRQNAPYPLDRFFTKAALEMSVNAASTGDAQAYGADGLTQSTGYWSKASLLEDFDPTAYWSTLMKKTEITNATAITDQNKNTFTEQDLKNNTAIVLDLDKGASRQPTLNISQPLANTTDANANDPVYLVIKGSKTGLDVLNVNFTGSNIDTVRPIIIAVDPNVGTSYEKIHLNFDKDGAKNNTFRGIIYTPRAENDGGVLMNSAYCTFMGSIISKRMTLRGTYSRFIYNPYGDGGSNEKGTKKTRVVGLDMNLSDAASDVGDSV